MRAIQVLWLLGVIGAFMGAFARYPAVRTETAIYNGFLVYSIVCALAASVGVRGTSMRGGRVRDSVGAVVKDSPCWCFVVSAIPLAGIVFLLATDGPVTGSMEPESLAAQPALGRFWLMICGVISGFAVAMAGAALSRVDAWYDASDE